MDEGDRLLAIDAARGIAMFFIGVSHISFYLINDSARLASDLRAIGFFATPNFLLLSGLACGYQLAGSPTMATALRILDRGLFVFLVGHLLVAGSLVYMVPAGTAFEHVVITDSIGILLCLAPLLKQISAQRLLWTGAAVYVVASMLALSWHPTTRPQILLSALLLAVNDGDMPDVGWVTPTLPYLGVFLLGVGLGKLIGQFRSTGRSRLLSAQLAAAGSAAVVLALAVNVGRHFLKPHLLAYWAPKNWADVILTTVNIRHDAPPTLAYLLFYGGLGVALVGFLGLARQGKPGLLLRAMRPAAVIGRASLVSYVLQQWMIDFVPVWVGFDSWLTPATAPLYLALNTVLMYWVARLWTHYQGNRWMTLGLKAGVGPRQPGMRAVALDDPPHRIPLFASLVALVVIINVLALDNAASLTPGKLALVPSHPTSHMGGAHRG